MATKTSRQGKRKAFGAAVKVEDFQAAQRAEVVKKARYNVQQEAREIIDLEADPIEPAAPAPAQEAHTFLAADRAKDFIAKMMKDELWRNVEVSVNVSQNRFLC